MLEQLGRGCANCINGNCKKIEGRGNPKASLVIIGESPNVKDLMLGIPFTGTVGEVLEANISEETDVYYLTAVSCQPKKKDPKVLASHVRSCQERLLAEIKAHPRKVILALGNGALWAVTNDFNLKITQVRGQRFPTELATHGIIACLHPSYLLRGRGSYKKFQLDVQYACDLASDLPPRKPIIPEFTVLRTESEVDGLLSRIPADVHIAVDIETTGFLPREDKMLSIGISWKPEHVYIIQGTRAHNLARYGYPEKEANILNDTPQMQQLKGLLENTEHQFIWQNGKFDIGFLREAGIQARVNEDTMLLNYCLDETRGVHDLGQIGSDLLGMPDWKGALEAHLPKKKATYGLIPEEVLQKYLAYDTSTTLQIFQILRRRVATQADLDKLYTKTLLPASEFLTKVSANGFMFDWKQWEQNKERLEIEVQAHRDNLSEIAGYSINPGSPKQVAILLYDELRLPCKSRSTAAKFIAKLPDVPAVRELRAFRVKNKQLTTYIVGLAKNIEADGKAHSTYLLHGTRTGRLASRNPNLQNIPRDPRMRAMFKARKGYILIDADYSQAELRCLASISRDVVMCAIYNEIGRSIHKEMAVELFGDDYNKEHYAQTKAVNFGIVYGRESFSLATEFDISIKEAQQMIDGWFARFPEAHKFILRCRAAPAKGSVLKTPFGRKCRPGLVARDNIKEVQNEFSNFPHQSIASDFTLHAGIILEPLLNAMDARIINLVHDSLIIECPDTPEAIHEVRELTRHHMEDVPRTWGFTNVPFLAEFKLSYSWDNPIEDS